VPLPRPGFYQATVTEYLSCVPTTACPGVSSDQIKTSFSTPAASGSLKFVLGAGGLGAGAHCSSYLDAVAMNTPAALANNQ
jgi:hypothetical protein